jgi:hypothetical protein
MKKTFGVFLPILIISGLTLAACNLPINKTPATESPSVDQTLAAATIQAKVGEYLTQTAQGSQAQVVTATPGTGGSIVYITATPQPATATSVPPTQAPTSTTVPIPCNQAGWVTDVTIPDGTEVVAGSSFVKTWRVRNTGSCTWGSGYAIVFSSGNAMGAAPSTTLPSSVQPGQTVDISVAMVAPADKGNYKGSWIMRAPGGSTFGVGLNGGGPVTVSIVVTTIPKPKDPNTIYDFVGNYCAAEWRTNAGVIGCPSSAVDYTSGSITRSFAPILENGLADDEGALITVPSKGGDGVIQGQFPAILIHSGDHFISTLLCSYQKPACNVTFEVLAQEKGSSTITSLGTWTKTYNNTTVTADLDLSSMDGKNIIFYLKVSSGGDSTDDFAQWMAARITHP